MAVVYPDVNSLWDALTAEWGAAGTYGLLLETYLAGVVSTTAIGAEFDGTPNLYDVLVTGGIPTAWPAAAVPAADVSIAQVIRQIYDDQVLIAGYIDTEIGVIDGIVDNILIDTAAIAWGDITTIDGIVDTIVARTQYHVIKETWFSAPDDVIGLTQAASDDNLPSVTLPVLAGRTIDRVFVGFAIGFIENTHAAANGLTAAINVRVMRDDGAWDTNDITAVALPDNSLMTGGSEKRAGVVFIGEADVSSEVDVFNDTYLMRLDGCTVDNDFLNLYDVQTFLVVIYH